ncbi:MAG TPA: glycosyltransferase family 1 protein [Terriglobales bacterium]|nr:glycosyltransferase family 1 protein [Terriglobales bacterium]
MHGNNLSLSPTDTARRRHFCIVTETFSPEINGVALTLSHLIAGLRKLGHTVSIVRPRQQGLDGFGRSYDPRVTLVHSLPLPGYRGLHIGLPAGSALRRCWSGHRPDAVYVATQGPLGWSAVRVARRLRIPLFSGFHTNFDNYAKHYHAGWLCPLILRYLRKFHNCTAGTIVPNTDLRNRLRALGLGNVAVLGRGVDSRLFAPQKRSAALRRQWRAADSDLVALYVGRLAAEKNLSLAVEAYRAMQRVNRAVKFVLVGDGPLRAALQKHHPDLIFSGVQSGEQLARHYASADVFLFPSETETFGNVTLEAMASGLVVVAYDYAAAHLHVRDGATGVLASRGDAAAFVAGAVELAGMPQSLAGMRRQARLHAMSVDWDLVVSRFAALLCGHWDPDDASAKEIRPALGQRIATGFPRELAS